MNFTNSAYDKKEDENRDHEPNLGELISLQEAAELSGLTPRHMRLLVSKSAIWGKKMGRDWFTTALAVREYMARDRRPGPKPQKDS